MCHHLNEIRSSNIKHESANNNLFPALKQLLPKHQSPIESRLNDIIPPNIVWDGMIRPISPTFIHIIYLGLIVEYDRTECPQEDEANTPPCRLGNTFEFAFSGKPKIQVIPDTVH